MMQRMSQKKNKFFIVFILLFLVLAAAVYFLGKYFSANTIIFPDEEVTFETDNWNYLIDFESAAFLLYTKDITNTRSLSGKYSSGMSTETGFSAPIVVPIPTSDSTELTEVNIRLWLNSVSPNINASIVFSIFDSQENQLHWDSYKIVMDDLDPDIWIAHNFKFEIPGIYVDTRNNIRVYLWSHNYNEYSVYLDDVSISFNDNLKNEKSRTFHFDFEDVISNQISSKYSRQGFYSTFAKGEDSFTASLLIPFSDMETESIMSIRYRFYILSESGDADAVFVCAVSDSDNNELFWQGTHVKSDQLRKGEWEMYNGEAFIPEDIISGENTIKFYLWNRKNNTIYLDDIYVVVKDKGYIDPDDMAICDLTINPDFVPLTNHPPYRIKYFERHKFGNEQQLNKHFLVPANRFVSGSFDAKYKTDQLLVLNKKDKFILYFDEYMIKEFPAYFEPELDDVYSVFSDDNLFFCFDSGKKQLSSYRLHKNNKFKLNAISEELKLEDLKLVVKPYADYLSLFFGDGSHVLLKQQDKEYVIVKQQQLTNPNQGNMKAFVGNFIESSDKHLLIISIEKEQHRYRFYTFNINDLIWELSDNHANTSIQSYDELNFFNEYHVGKFRGKNRDELLMLDLSRRFNMKVTEFNKLGYNILFEGDFLGFDSPQNPKFYERRRIITGNFLDKNKTDLIVFQDNVRKTEGFFQKTELYTLKKN